MGSGGNHIVAGLAAAVLLPLGTFVLQLPFPIVLVIAAVLYAALALLLAPRRAAERIRFGGSSQAQAALVGELVEEGEASIGRLRAAAKALRGKAAGATIERLADVARGILDRLAAEPEKLPAVRRFLSYYLPQSADLAEGVVVVENQRNPDLHRLGEIATTLVRLGDAFAYYADSLNQRELDSLDVELKLLTRSLAEDLGPAAAREVVARSDKER